MRLKTTALPLACGLALLTAFGTVNAETADRSKPIEINADNFQGDEVKQVAIYTGRVEVHQGTLEILGDKLTVTISPEGYRTITVTGNPVRMKERRDVKTPGVEEWVHASSLTAVYEEQSDVITLTDKGVPGVIWTLQDAMPIGYELSPMDGSRSEVLTESITFAFTGMKRTTQPPVPR